jgi:hypothetical protein
MNEGAQDKKNNFREGIQIDVDVRTGGRLRDRWYLEGGMAVSRVAEVLPSGLSEELGR